MDDSITIDELVENLDVRHRLSLTLTPDDVPPAVGEAFALQLASVGTNGDSPADPLHVGVGIKQPFPPGHTFRALETILEKDVAVLPGEATDFGGALGTVVDGEVRRRHITDPDVQVTVLSGVEFVADRLQTALGRAMSTGTVSLDTVHTDHTAATAGGITVAGPVDSGTPVDEALPIQTEGASHLDLVVATGLPTNELWLIPPINKAIKAVLPAVAREYLRRVQQVETVVSDDARTHLEVYASDLSRATDTATPKSIPTPATVVATVERLAHATARLELTETVTTAHLESAVRLHDAALRYRSYTAESPAYWRDCAGDPAYYT